MLYLLLHRGPQSGHAGQWEAASGPLAEQDDLIAAAKRVVALESGLQPMALYALDYLHSYFDPQDGRIHLAPVFAAEVAEEAVTTASDVDASRWVTYDQAMEMLRRPGHRKGLQRTHEDVVSAVDRGGPFRISR